MKETPFPFTVSAMIMLGLPGSKWKRVEAPRRRRPCRARRCDARPSRSARQRASSGSRFSISFVLPRALHLVEVDDGQDVVEAVVRGEARRPPTPCPRPARRRTSSRRCSHKRPVAFAGQGQSVALSTGRGRAIRFRTRFLERGSFSGGARAARLRPPYDSSTSRGR